MALSIGSGITIGGGISLALGATPVITITSQPSNQSTYATGTATFVVSATVTESASLSYQWQIQQSGIGAWSDIVGATSGTYTTGVLSVAADNGDKYRCVVSATGGATSVNSNAATLTVTAAVITITSQPSSTTVAEGGTATFSVSATVTQSATLSYQWELQPGGVGGYSSIGGATSSSYTTGTLSASDNNNSYRAYITANRGAIPINTNGATLTVSGGGGGNTATGTMPVANSGAYYGAGGPTGASLSISPAVCTTLMYITMAGSTVAAFPYGTYGSVVIDASGIAGKTNVSVTVNGVTQTGTVALQSTTWVLTLSGDPFSFQTSVGSTFNVSISWS